MRLTIGGGTAIENPSEAQIEAALRALPGGTDSFAILATARQHYIQTLGGANEGFVLEYREGSDDTHFQHFTCSQAPCSLEQVLAAFLSYCRGDGAFKRTLEWELEEGAPVSSSWVAQGMLVFFLVVAALVLWRVFS